MKRSAIILLVIALVSIMTIYSESSSADESSPTQFTWENFTFEVSQPAEVKLISYTESPVSHPERVEIPSTVEHEDQGKVIQYTVVRIDKGAFSDCEYAKTIVIPDTVTSIDEYAFDSDCIECFVADSKYYFSDEEGVLFEGVRSLFRYPPAKADTSYTISSTTAQIVAGAFSNAKQLQKISIGPWVLRISDYAFLGCTELEEVSFMGSVPGLLGKGAFFGCSKLTSIALPPELVSIGDMAFGKCSSLKSIEIPENVTYIGEGVFYKCESLESIAVEEYNTKFIVFEHALYGIDSQSRITTLIAFPAAYAPKDGTFEIPDGDKGKVYVDADGNKKTYPYDIHIDEVQGYAFSASQIETLILSPSMASIGMMAFAEMAHLKNINIPKNISKIDYGAFTNCTALEKIDVGVNTTLIGTLAFSGCTLLKEIILHENLTTIEDFAFKNTILVSIEIPSSVTSLGGYIFNNCLYLEHVTIYSKDVYAEDTFNLINSSNTVTVESHSGALKNLGSWSDNVVFVNFEKRSFPMMNLVGIVVCLLILLVILNFLRRI